MPTPGTDANTLSHTELATFTRQLGAMLHAGVNVLRALRIASQYSGNRELIDAAGSVARSLEDGKEFHQSIARHPEVFGPFYVEMARQGEADGTLGQALLGVADYLDHVVLGTAAPGAEPSTAPVPMPAGPGVGAPVLSALGAMGVGAAVVGSLAAAGLLPDPWVFPLAAGWGGLCFLATAKKLQGEAPPEALVPAPSVSLPPKSAQRRAAETDGIVRSALQEQEEADEAEQNTAGAKSASNGQPAVAPELLLPPDERVPPRFDL
ncbi:MAG: type secretion system protein [Armatimonadetes bacterium]|nr:type secretion system protein [Armatimonadota bacterium]